MQRAKSPPTTDEADVTSLRLHLTTDSDAGGYGNEVIDGGNNSACADSFSAEQSTSPPRDCTTTTSRSSTIRFGEEAAQIDGELSSVAAAATWVNSVNGTAVRAGNSVSCDAAYAASVATFHSDDASMHGRLRLGASTRENIGSRSQSKQRSTETSCSDDDERQVRGPVGSVIFGFSKLINESGVVGFGLQ